MDTFLPQGFDEIFQGATKGMITDTHIKCVLIAYEKALADPKAVLPTYLHAALEGLKRV